MTTEIQQTQSTNLVNNLRFMSHAPDDIYAVSADEIDRLTKEVGRFKKANGILEALWEKNKIRHTKDGCSCRFEENGDLLESCKFHGDDKAKADALAEAVNVEWRILAARKDDELVKNVRTALLAALTVYQGGDDG